MTTERFPGERALLARVAAHVAYRNMVRDLYTDDTGWIRSHILHELQIRFEGWLARPPDERATPFPMIVCGDELGTLELYMRERIGKKQLVVFEERSDDVITRDALAIIRVKNVTGSDACAGKFFRDTVTRMTASAVPTVLDGCAPKDSAVVTILRAALPMAVAYRDAGVHTFGVVTASRGHDSLRPTIAYQRLPHNITQAERVVVVDPAFATGGSVMATIELLQAQGVPLDRIVVHTVDVAPEGVLLFRRRYPTLQIVTHSRSNQLNEVGYIIGCGLGDAGDLAMADITLVNAGWEWVRRGILTFAEASDVVRRSASLAA